MNIDNVLHVEVIYDDGEECYIVTSGRGKLRLNQKTAVWLYSWLGRNLTQNARRQEVGFEPDGAKYFEEN